MNGAEALIRGLVNSGVNVCFANPGTSEMHMVQAIDAVDDMRAVLCLFEGVCSGAADGYGRMKGTPASTLLHLGAGLGNAIANLHNAKRASTPVVNLVGDHAGYHLTFDAPLTSDIETIAAGVSAWIRTSGASEAMAQDAFDAVQASLSAKPDYEGNVATLIVPADCSWGNGQSLKLSRQGRSYADVSNDGVMSAVETLGRYGADAMLLLDGAGLSAEGIKQAGRIAKKTGCQVYSTTFPARVESGPGLFAVQRMPYFPEHVMATLSAVKGLVLAGAKSPVSFFAYPNTPSDLVPDECVVASLAMRHQDVVAALKRTADALDAPDQVDTVAHGHRPEAPTGALNTGAVAQALAALMPEQSIVAVDSGGGGAAYPVLQKSVRHTWLNLTGGSIGQGGPVAVGAAIACPDRRVFALLGDGGAGYTLQYLWTAARERLSIVTVIFSNRSYNILDVEYNRLGVNSVGEKAASLFDLSNPDIDWVSLAKGYGVGAVSATTSDEFSAALAQGIASDGPFLIEANVIGRE